MTELATIFVKIKEHFFNHQSEQEKGEEHRFFFPLFSLGYTNDDFLFLNSESAANQAQQYYDELLEFSLLANNIPRIENIFELSGENADLLYNPYKEILEFAKLIDSESLTAEQLKRSELFEQALEVLENEEKGTYLAFREMSQNLEAEIKELRETIDAEADPTTALDLELKEKNLGDVQRKWEEEGHKNTIEQAILEIVKNEAERFKRKFFDNKGKLETFLRSNPSGSSFYYTSCIPNNLYKSDTLPWERVTVNKTDINELMNKAKEDGLENIFGETDEELLPVKSISFEITYASILREWFDSYILESPFWNIALLDKDAISIPQYSNKLVFVRNIKVEFDKNVENKTTTPKLKTVGPFVLSNQLQQGKFLKLHSVNKALKVPRFKLLKAVQSAQKANIIKAAAVKNNTFSSISTIAPLQPKARIEKKKPPHLKPLKVMKAKQVSQVKKAVVSKKAPIRTIGIARAPVLTKVHRVSAVQVATPLLITNSNTRRVKLYFREQGTEQNLAIGTDQIQVLRNEKVVNTQIVKNTQGAFELKLDIRYNYQVQIADETLAINLFPLNFNNQDKGKNLIPKVYHTQYLEVPEETEDEFQLIAVICKAVVDYPNPIRKAKYL